jgi:hypothetical protein
MDLSLDHPALSADLFCDIRCLSIGVCDGAAWNRNAEGLEQVLGLILMNIHEGISSTDLGIGCFER